MAPVKEPAHGRFARVFHASAEVMMLRVPSRSVRHAVLCAGMLFVAGAVRLQAVQLTVGADTANGGSSLFPTDHALLRKLKRSRELLAEPEPRYVEAAKELQKIVDDLEHAKDEDSFVPVELDGKTIHRSARSETQRMIGDMPAAGRKAYEDQYGPAARQMLNDALESGSDTDLSLITRLYFHTQAGYEAAYRLATVHLDHGRPLAAAFCFDRLRQTPNARGQFEPLLTLKTALAWERAGLHDDARAALAELGQRSPNAKLKLGEREVALPSDAAATATWLATISGPTRPGSVPGQDEWPLFRGDAARNARGSGGSPYLNGGWRVSLIGGGSDNPLDKIVDRAFNERLDDFHQNGADRNFPGIPSGHPLVVDDLLIVRDYAQLRAYRLADGKPVWTSVDRDKSARDVLEIVARSIPQSQGSPTSPLSILLAQRAWRDATFGTLSSDGQLVFAVEDLGFLGPWGYNAATPHPLSPRGDNRLAAYDVRTGKAVWEAGGPPEYSGELAGAYFLGPPLVLDQRLYCLAERSGEIRLLVLEPRSGRVDWSQTLLRPDGNLLYDANRRQCGLSPSYLGGVLVCPTEAGAIVAVDLTTRSLLWRYVYTPGGTTYEPRALRMNFNRQQESMNALRNQAVFGNDQARWLDAVATVAEGRVLLTPRDGSELHCLKLSDGSFVWKRPRGEGLYLACVHAGKAIIASKTHLQALRLADGEPAWSEPTSLPLPSGRGYASGDLYYVPLTTAEVATVDLNNGRLVARTLSRDGQVPGNLIGLRGVIVSQRVDMIECFKELDALEAEIAASLQKNPADPAALALRGEIFLQRGMTQEAYADLKRVLEIKSDDARVREILLGSLLEGMRVDFATYRKATDDVERLLDTPEQRLTYLRLLAGGLERTGERAAAFDVYLKFVDLPSALPDMERIEGALSVGRVRLVRSRLATLYARAAPAEREAMEGRLRTRFDALRDAKKPDEVRRFLDFFGGDFAGMDARRRLVDELASTGNWLELERWLRPLEQSQEPQVAAEATARFAAMLIAAERPLDAAPAVRRLAERWPEVVCLDGKTGSQLAAEWRKKPEIDRAAGDVSPWLVGLVEAERKENPGNLNPFRTVRVPIIGRRDPFFTDVTIEIDTRGQELTARDGLGRPLWKVTIGPVYPYYLRAYVYDHLVLLVVGSQVVAVDTLGTAAEPGARVLWQQSLVENTPGPNGSIAVNVRQVLPGRGQQQFIFVDQNGQPAGSIGPVTHEAVCLQRGRKLLAVETLSGRTLWMREDLTPGSEIFGDEEFVFIVPPGAEEANVYRALDGTAVALRPVPPASSRLAILGRRIASWTLVEGHQHLVLYDVWSREIVWRKEFAPDAKISLIDLDEMAVLEPRAWITMITLASGRVRWAKRIETPPEVVQMLVFRSAEQYTVIANSPLPVNGNAARVLTTGTSVQVNGNVYGFDRATGRQLWMTPVERQAIDVFQPAHLPVLTFACQFAEPSRIGRQPFGILVLDKRNGRIVYEDKRDEPVYGIETVALPDQQRLDLRFYQSILRLTFTDKPVP